MHGYFRLKSILILLVFCIVVAAGWFFAHRFQIRSLNARFLEQATRDEASGNLDRAARFYRLYLFLRPDDTEARLRSAKLKEKRARNGAALRDALADYEHVLVKHDDANDSPLEPADRTDLRLRAARIYLLVGKVDHAQKTLARIEKTDYAKPAVQFLLGECYRLKEDLARAKECYWSTIKADATKLEAYVLLAALLEGEHSKKDQATKHSREPANDDEQDKKGMPTNSLTVLNRLVADNADNFRAFLVRAEFRRRSHGSDNTQEAIAGDLLTAQKLAPNDADVLLASASMKVLLARRAESDEARAPLLADARVFLQHAAVHHPKDARVLSAQVDVEIMDAGRGTLAGRPENSDWQRTGSLALATCDSFD
jgi:tetratricopeptide (TPR) repeat protein